MNFSLDITTLSGFQTWNIIILLIVFFSIMYLRDKYKNDPVKSKSLPSIFTIIGVFGTFFGITLGLMNFDASPEMIEESVAFLLSGMRLAFGSSIIGMFFAIQMRIDNIENAKPDEDIEEGKKVIALLEGLQASFQEFAEKQTQMNMDALVEALEKVIADFNQQMQEQFGENFKKLNEAVFKLVDWQENYYKQIEYMVENIERTQSAVENTKKIIQDIAEKYSDTYKLTEEFQLAIATLNDENKKLISSVENFAKIADQASQAVPMIKEEVNDLTKGFTSTVQGSLGTIQEASEKTNAEISNTIDSSTRQINTQLTDLYQNSFSQLEQLQNKMSEDLNKNILEMDGALGNALQNSLNSLSSQLQTLSSQFVSDYQPITRRLRDVIRMAEEQQPSQTSEAEES